MENHLNPFLAAFGKGFVRQSIFLKLLEDWCKALDNHECAAAILIDLLKAFDLKARLLKAQWPLNCHIISLWAIKGGSFTPGVLPQ